MARDFEKEFSLHSRLCANEEDWVKAQDGVQSAVGTGAGATVEPSESSLRATCANRAAAIRDVNRKLAAFGLDAPADTSSYLPVASGLGMKDSTLGVATLSSLLSSLPPSMGVNIELKYPTDEEVHTLGLHVKCREAWFHCVWECILLQNKIGRPVVFSSFDPQLCSVARRWQAVYPVLFLTMGGVGHMEGDDRMNSLAAALAWCREADLQGIVTHTFPLQKDNQLRQVARECSEGGLILGTFGAHNNDFEWVKRQKEEGVHLVILDALHVAVLTTEQTKK